MVPALERIGMLTEVDGMALAGYCSAVAKVKEAERQDTIGPWFTVWERSWRQVLRFAIEYGFTPASRTRITVPKQTNDERKERLVD